MSQTLQVTRFLQKYFESALRYYDANEFPLAAFFALTTVEETSKWMIIGGRTSETDGEIKRLALNHGNKYFDAAVNLLRSDPVGQDLPRDLMLALWDIFQPPRATELRSKCLYMRFDQNGQFTFPDEMIDRNDAALLVYGAGVALGSMSQYSYAIDETWSRQMFAQAEKFRRNQKLFEGS